MPAPSDQSTAISAAAAATSPAVKSAQRTVEILELMAATPHSLTLTEIQRALDVPKSSLYALLQTLVNSGWLQTDTRGTTYQLGLGVLRAGAAFLEADPTVEAAGVVLTELRATVNETVHLARLDGAEIVYLASRESLHQLRTTSRIGRRLPAPKTALGLALLSSLPWHEVESVLPFPAAGKRLSAAAKLERSDLRAELERTSMRGWAIERGLSTPGMGCVAVTVPHHSNGAARDAISCSVPLDRLTDDRLPYLVNALAQAAREIGFKSGMSRWS